MIFEDGEEAILLAHADYPIAWYLMPDLTNRIRRFAYEHEKGIDLDLLTNRFQNSFVNRSGDVFAMVAIRDFRIIGHILYHVYEEYGKKRLVITQYEINHKEPPKRDLQKRMWEAVKEWARANGIRELSTYALGEIHERAYRTYWGFDRDRILMTQEV